MIATTYAMNTWRTLEDAFYLTVMPIAVIGGVFGAMAAIILAAPAAMLWFFMCFFFSLREEV